MEQPLVSVIVPNYCYANYLPRRIESILNQTYKNFEVIILDDCSTDNSVEVINSYKDNPHISAVVVNEKNSGSVFLQWDKGMRLAKGELIWIAECDDYCELNFLETLVKAFTFKDGCVIAYTTSHVIDENGKEWNNITNSGNQYFHGRTYIKRYLSFTNTIANASSAIFRKETALSISDIYKSFHSAGDTMFWILLAEHGNVAVVNKGLNYFMRHTDSVTNMSVMRGVTYIEEKRIHEYLLSRGLISYLRNIWIHVDHAMHIMYTNFADGEVRQNVCHVWEVGKYTKDIYLFLFRIYTFFKKKNIYI